MKTGIRFLTLAGLLLALPCLAAPQRSTHVYSPTDPVPVPTPGPVFDHDPMSITFDSDATYRPYKNKYGRISYRLRKSRPLSLTAGVFLHTIKAGDDLKITVNFAMDDTSYHALNIDCFKYLERPSGDIKLNKLSVGSAYTVTDVSSDATMHKFKINFAKSVLKIPGSNPVAYKPYQKIFIDAWISNSDGSTEDCFQTVTVYL